MRRMLTCSATLDTVLPVGIGPNVLQVSEQAGLLYVLSSGSALIQAIQPSTGKPVLERTLDFAAEQMRLSDVAKTIYVGSPRRKAVSLFDLNLNWRGDIDLDDGPLDLSVSEDGRFLVVLCSHSVIALDTVRNHTDRVPLPSNYEAESFKVDYSSQGRIIVIARRERTFHYDLIAIDSISSGYARLLEVESISPWDIHVDWMRYLVLVGGGGDESLRVISAKDGVEIKRIGGVGESLEIWTDPSQGKATVVHSSGIVLLDYLEGLIYAQHTFGWKAHRLLQLWPDPACLIVADISINSISVVDAQDLILCEEIRSPIAREGWEGPVVGGDLAILPNENRICFVNAGSSNSRGVFQTPGTLSILSVALQ